MVPTEKDDDQALLRLREHRTRYAAAAGDRLHGDLDCQYSLLPFQELERTAGVWYEAAHEALMRANYGPLDALIREQVQIGSEQGFELHDMLLLLRILRQVAIEEEDWNPDMLVEMDAVVDEAISSLRGKVAWNIPRGLNYLTGESEEDRERVRLAAEAARGRQDRRNFSRNKLHMPIRVNAFLPGGPVDEITRTENVARGGIYFFSGEAYYKGAHVRVNYPYWDNPGAINPEYVAEVVRVEERVKAEQDKSYNGVALHFLGDLGKPKKKKESS